MALSTLDSGRGGGTGSVGGGSDDELKTQFMTREGTYRLMTLSEYSRPNRVGYANNGQGGSAAGAGAPVRVSFVTLPRPLQAEACDGTASSGAPGGKAERITFNFGREIFVYPYRGVRKAADLTKPIDKRIYKGTYPTCHDFGMVNDDSEEVPLLVGFSGGQIQLVDPVRKELSKLFNEERNVDKTRVTCIKWIPGSPNCFLVSYASGNMYVYNHEIVYANTSPAYQVLKQGKGYTIYTCKTKSTRNPLYKWTVGRGAINEFSFSPCGHFLAVVSQDGYLRIFNYDTMDVVGLARSYFGGLLCACWSPDGKYVVCGGEDDLVTVYSVENNRVVVRGQGHKSWVSVVAFDQYNMSYGDLPDGLDFSGSDEEGQSGGPELNTNSTTPTINCDSVSNVVTCYRFGSVGQDTLICLWDITEDVLKQSCLVSSSNVATQATTSINKASPSGLLSSIISTSNSTTTSQVKGGAATQMNSASPASSSKDSGLVDAASSCSSSSVGGTTNSPSTSVSLSHRLASLNFGNSDRQRGDKRNSSGRGTNTGSSSKSSSQTSLSLASSGGVHGDDAVELGTPQCPRIHETPVIEPLVTKKIAHERLTALVFREECLVTACQDGYVCTWARPGKVNGQTTSNVMCPGSPQTATGVGGGGTIV